jgi:hypothetical protein
MLQPPRPIVDKSASDIKEINMAERYSERGYDSPSRRHDVRSDQCAPDVPGARRLRLMRIVLEHHLSKLVQNDKRSKMSRSVCYFTASTCCVEDRWALVPSIKNDELNIKSNSAR